MRFLGAIETAPLKNIAINDASIIRTAGGTLVRQQPTGVVLQPAPAPSYPVIPSNISSAQIQAALAAQAAASAAEKSGAVIASAPTAPGYIKSGAPRPVTLPSQSQGTPPTSRVISVAAPPPSSGSAGATGSAAATSFDTGGGGAGGADVATGTDSGASSAPAKPGLGLAAILAAIMAFGR